MRKLFTSLILGVAALMLTTSYSVFAQSSEVYACIKNNGTISYQDKYCTKNKKPVSKKNKHGTNSSINIGLRPQEVLMLKQLQERRLAESSSKNPIKLRHEIHFIPK